MADPHSLLPSSSQPTVHTKQTQLPFSPSSPTVAARFQLPPSPIKPQPYSGPNLSRSQRTESMVSRHSRAQHSVTHSVGPPTPSSSTHPGGGSTHVGGILPSAAFFHPSKPRPPSVVSVSTQDISESLHVVPEHSFDSDVEDERLYRHLSTSTKFSARQKQSREPLLPIGGPLRKVNLTSPPTPTLPSSPSSSQHPHVPTLSAPSRMRNSLDKFRKGMSLESTMKSIPSLKRIITRDSSVNVENSTMTDEGMTFELKPTDSGRISPLQYFIHKRSSSPKFADGPGMSDQKPTFIPTPPPNSADLTQVPVIDAGGRTVHRYELHPSRNRFFCGGRLLTGGDSPWAFLASLIVVFGISGVYFGTTIVWWWKNESPAVACVGAYMTLFTISAMMTTAFSDPGILPRYLDSDPPYPCQSPSDGGVKTPIPRDLRVRAGVVRVKYCSTCRTYRPPRSSHCKMCDNCVDGCDHHCQWVNNCVGRRNYASFFVFLLSAVSTLFLIIVTSALHLYLITVKQHVDFRHALGHGVGSAVAFTLSIIVIWPVTALLVYHLRLLVLNATTIEQIRNQAHKALVSGPAPPNPFSHGNWRRNLAYVLCRPPGFSWLDAANVATEDQRAVNPGMEEYYDEEETGR